MNVFFLLSRIFLIVLLSQSVTFGQFVLYEKAIWSNDGHSVYLKNNTNEGLVFSKSLMENESKDLVQVKRRRLTKTDIMWDVCGDTLYYIRFRKNVDYLTCNISAFHDTIHLPARDDESKYPNYNVYTKPPSLEQNFIQAFIFDNKRPVDFYQPYDFLIDSDGVYFIVANMHDNNYELWHYSGPFFPNLDPNDRKRVEAFRKSKRKWKKYILTGIQEQPEQANIALVKDQGRLLLFTSRGKIYQIHKKRTVASTTFVGAIDNDFSNLLLVVNKKSDSVSYVNQSEDVSKNKHLREVSMLSLNDILKKK